MDNTNGEHGDRGEANVASNKYTHQRNVAISAFAGSSEIREINLAHVLGNTKAVRAKPLLGIANVVVVGVHCAHSVGNLEELGDDTAQNNSVQHELDPQLSVASGVAPALYLGL